MIYRAEVIIDQNGQDKGYQLHEPQDEGRSTQCSFGLSADQHQQIAYAGDKDGDQFHQTTQRHPGLVSAEQEAVLHGGQQAQQQEDTMDKPHPIPLPGQISPDETVKGRRKKNC